jgi:hypothetical protein
LSLPPQQCQCRTDVSQCLAVASPAGPPHTANLGNQLRPPARPGLSYCCRPFRAPTPPSQPAVATPLKLNDGRRGQRTGSPRRPTARRRAGALRVVFQSVPEVWPFRPGRPPAELTARRLPRPMPARRRLPRRFKFSHKIVYLYHHFEHQNIFRGVHFLR